MRWLHSFKQRLIAHSPDRSPSGRIGPGRAGQQAPATSWPPGIPACAIAGALVGAFLAMVLSVSAAFNTVLFLGALGALAGWGAGDRTIEGTLTLRLLLAAVWLAVGLGDPTPLGLVAAVFGASFGLLALADARRALRRERVRARLLAVRASRRATQDRGQG